MSKIDLQYIKDNNLEIPSVYGEIVDVGGQLKTTDCKRTGCIFCLFGCHLENQPNRIQRLAITHPKQYKFCMEELKFRDVMEYMKIPFEPIDKNLEEW